MGYLGVQDGQSDDEVTRFTPGPGTAGPLRRALGRFVTGVTVVTVPTAEGAVGITANSFTSVSLDPPLVLWCPARTSRRFGHFADAPHFSIHVLGAGQMELARRFASGDGHFTPGPEGLSTEGVPVLPDVLARFDCALHAEHDGGDHLITVGRVLRVTLRPGAPLVFAGGDYGQFAAGT
jgi:flavin reductase (DIM6/NTAB) family NADH-FMN oxidoreductase RutF